MADSYLENALVKLSRQLVAFDEASLMDLWEKYAEAVRMKNQLFNYNLSASRQPGAQAPGLGMLDLTAPQAPQDHSPSRRPSGAEGEGRATGGQPDRPAGRSSVRLGKPKAGKLIPLHRSED